MKKILLTFLTFLILFSSLAPNFLIIKAQDKDDRGVADKEPQAPAEGTWYDQDYWQWRAKVYDDSISPSNEIFGERYTAAQVQWVVYSLISLVLHSGGETSTEALNCVQANDIANCGDAISKALESLRTSPPNNNESGSLNNSIIAGIFSLRPLSGIGYFQQKINKFKLIPEAQAQGFGFTAANPVQKLWSAVRDLSFGLIVIVTFVMAFMIMFRIKISPQVVITLQSAIPRVVIALILITFSYAIAGFLIDLMYIVMGMFSTFLASSSISSLNASDLFKDINEGNILSTSILYLVTFYISFIASFNNYGKDIVGESAGGLGGMIGIILFVVVAIILIFSIFKILWILLKAYASFLLTIVVGPLQILLGVMTTQGGFNVWIKSLIKHLLVYPTITLMYVLAFFFLAQSIPVEINYDFPFGVKPGFLTTSSGWSPPFMFGNSLLGLLWLGVSYAIMVLLPNTVEILQSIISEKPFAYGSAIGESSKAPFVSAVKTIANTFKFGRILTGGGMPKPG